MQVILARKPDVLQLALEDEDGMIHSVLNALPSLSDDSEIVNDVPPDQHTRSGSLDEEDMVTFNTEETKRLLDAPDEISSNELSTEQQQMMEQIQVPGGASTNITDGEVVRGENSVAADAGHSAENWTTQASDDSRPVLFLAQPQESEGCPVNIPSETRINSTAEINTDTQPSQPQLVPPHPPSLSRPTSTTSLGTSRSNSRNVSRSSSSPPQKSSRTISLPSLLTHAAQLLETYPPTLPELRVKDILGPKSVVHTWRPPQDDLPTRSDNERDDDAESWVGSPDVVVPFIEDEDIEESENEQRTKSRKGPVTRHRRLVLLHRLRLRFGLLTLTEKRILLLGAVAAISLAVALRQNRGFSDTRKGWIAWAWAFAGGFQFRSVE